MMRRLICGALVLCTLVWMTGCTSIFTRTEDDSPTQTPAPQETVPQRGGDLFVAIPENITTFDPLAATDHDLIDFLSLIYESPFAYDENGRLQNELVDSWDVSEDGRTYTFRIRDDVYFSDATKLTARDVYESAQRALEGVEPDSESEPTPTPDPTPEPSASAGASATPAATLEPSDSSYAQRFADFGANITSIDLEDDAVVVRTREPGNAVLHFMTFPVTKATYQETDQPLGTGPYAVSGSFNSDEQVTLEVNSSWWKDAPYIERIVGVPASGQKDKIDMQQTSLLDFVTTNALNAGNYAISGKSVVIDYMTNYFDCLVPNLATPGLRDPDVRHAISDALDRREILSTVLLNHGVPSNFPIAPDSFLMDARYRSNQRDVATALTLLGTAGYRTEQNGNGRTLSLTLIVPDVLDSTYMKEAARAIRKQLAEVFIEVTVEELSQTEYAQRLASQDFDLAYVSYYLSTVPDLTFMLTQNGDGNYNGFSDMELDQALEACAAAITEQEMIEAYAHLQELLNMHMPVIGLYFRMNSIVCDEGIGGISGVREETMYSDIGSWYTVYTTRSAGAASSLPTASVTASRQTEPDGIQSGQDAPVESAPAGTQDSADESEREDDDEEEEASVTDTRD